jgi:hypothetical protein
LFDDSPEAHGHVKILGGGMVGTHAGDMIGEIVLAIQMGADAVDIGKTIHPPPTLGQSHWHGGGDCAWVLYGCAAAEEVRLQSSYKRYKFSSWPRRFREGCAAFLIKKISADSAVCAANRLERPASQMAGRTL